MDIKHFDKHLKCVTVSGYTLNLEEIMHLKIAFKQLVNNFDVKNVLFWGKILGTLKDYYIV